MEVVLRLTIPPPLKTSTLVFLHQYFVCVSLFIFVGLWLDMLELGAFQKNLSVPLGAVYVIAGQLKTVCLF